MKDALPRFKDLLELLKSGESASQRIRFSIQSFYKDLFAFFESVAMVFTRKNGREYIRVQTPSPPLPFFQPFSKQGYFY